MPESMAVAAWDTDKLGTPIVEGYGYSSGSDFVGYNIADAYTEFGQNIIDAPSLCKVTCLMPPDKFQYFEAFWRWTLRQGANWFTMPFRTGLGLVTLDAHITGGYTSNFIPGSDAFEVSFDVEFGYGRYVRTASLPWLFTGSSKAWKATGQDLAWSSTSG